MFLRKQLNEILEKTDIPFCFFYNSYLVITLTGKKKKRRFYYLEDHGGRKKIL